MATSASERTRRLLPVGPILLLALGGLLLLNNMGLISWDLGRTLLTAWPLVLVLLGIQALASGRVDWLSLFTLLAIVGVLSAGTHLVGPFTRSTGPAPGVASKSLQQDLRGAQRARVQVEFGAGQLTAGPLPDATPAIRAALAGDSGAELSSSFNLRDGVAVLEIGRGGRSGPSFFGGGGSPIDRLSLELPRGVPLELEIEAGAANTTLDLRDLTISNLRYETGASRSTIFLPSSGITRAEIEGGAAAIVLVVPEAVAARIETSPGGWSKVRIDEKRFPRTAGAYESPNYSSAPNRVHVTIKLGASSIEVR